MAKRSIDKIIEDIVNDANVTKQPSMTEFLNRIHNADLLAQFVFSHRNAHSFEYNNILNEATKSQIVATASAVEVYFKTIIPEFAGKWSQEGMENLLKEERISLSKAFSILKNTVITQESIIARSYNFQSLDQIESTMSKLSGLNDFYGVIEHQNFASPETYATLINSNPEWKRDLGTLFSLRNRIIHEPNDLIVVPTNQASDLNSTALMFAVAINAWIHSSDAKPTASPEAVPFKVVPPFVMP